MGNIYAIWLSKFGKEEADKRNADRIKKLRLAMSNWHKNAGPEHQAKLKASGKALGADKTWAIGKTWEQIQRGGKEAVEARRQRLIKSKLGKRNPMFGKAPPGNVGQGYSGRYKSFHFRSLLELSFILACETRNIKVVSAECNSFTYYFNGIEGTYRPDFFLPETNEFIEIKPVRYINQPKNLAKLAAVSALRKIRYVTDKDLKQPDISKIPGVFLDPKMSARKRYLNTRH
jgi:hypothetical protein